MILQLRSCCRLLHTTHLAGIRSWHQLSHTSQRIASPLLRNGANKSPPTTTIIRWKSSTEAATATKVKFRKEDVRRLFRFAKGEGYTILGGIGCLFISSAITMAVPYGLGRILDTVYQQTSDLQQAKEKLTQFCLVLVGVFLVGGVANFGRVYLFNRASLRIVKGIRERLYAKMMQQEAAWFDTKGTGELINRLSTDAFKTGHSLSQNVSDGLRSIVMILTGSGMMAYTSLNLSLVSMAIVPCVAGMAIVYGRYLRNITRQLLDQLAETMKVSEERLGNVKTVKMFCREPQESRLFAGLLDRLLGLGYQETTAKAVFFGLTGLSGNVLVMSVLFYGGNLVASGELTVGALTSFILYSGYVGVSLAKLSTFYSELNAGLGAAHRIWEIFDRQPRAQNALNAIRPNELRGEIEFQSVAFNYPSRPEQVILRDLSLKIAANTSTAIVGKSGSGKSTIVGLLLRLYDPDEGQVRIDGRDVRELDVNWLRTRIGAVNQEPVLFSGTIRENIMYGVEEDQRDTVDFAAICKQACVDEFVQRLPEGYETLVGQRGMMLSGGQKQRVAIARALIKDPQILLLDEATSALDAASEQYVRMALESLAHGRTVLTIAHRLSTIRSADRILVLDGGRIVEAGTYEDLVTRPEFHMFKSLVKLQAFKM